jgi:hypothetical protein
MLSISAQPQPGPSRITEKQPLGIDYHPLRIIAAKPENMSSSRLKPRSSKKGSNRRRNLPTPPPTSPCQPPKPDYGRDELEGTHLQVI